ncbi:MAG TPA: hypothetical protein VF017_15935 [Thermoanaerobaculia bacterium]|nr:hypothetical protein [Thermoanaerobaculia bacterium]
MRPADNPFRAQRLAALRYRFTQATPSELIERLAGLDHRAALVGAHGSGKSMLMAALGSALAEQGFALRQARLHVGPGEPARLAPGFLAELTSRHFLLVDSAGVLGGWSLRKLLRASRRAGGLLVTLHQPGPLPTLLECHPGPELLAELIEELAGAELAARLPPAEELFARHRGNLREALRGLYDWCGRGGGG